jgi:TatD DNase family protein
MIDTHCHLTFDGLAGDIEGVIERSRLAGVDGWITVGTDIAESVKAVELAGRFGNLYAAVAVHPHDAAAFTAGTAEQLLRLGRSAKVAAIGETGLDYHYDNSPRREQALAFARHLDIAAELDLPVIVHCREAFEDTLAILDRSGFDCSRAVFHCFGGSAEQADVLVARGCYISFTGVVTFKNAEKPRAAAAAVPPERLMLETDCPYMSPEPVRRRKINEPALLVHTAAFLAALKGMALEELAAATTANAERFFGLP